MRRICLTIEYDGTDFVGWQFQPNGISVQETIEAALSKLLKEPVGLISASRTDAGVHARGMRAHFDTATDLPPSAYREGVNALLPPSVAIVAARTVSDEFHARYSAAGKWYRYTILIRDVRSPLHRRQSWYLRTPLDIDAMRAAAAHFVGRHDFRLFRTSGCAARTTVRDIRRVEVRQRADFIDIDVYGSGFLRNMVRLMVGTLVEVGRGRKHPDVVVALLGGSSTEVGATAPAHGLCLMEVEYPSLCNCR